jgi:hypothetical protein
MGNSSDYYVVPGYVLPGYVYSYLSPSNPDWNNIPVSNIIDTVPSYLYEEYAPDDNVNAFFTAFNNSAQNYLSYLVNLNLPVWTSDALTGDLLTWVALGLYGYKRPTLVLQEAQFNDGIYNSSVYDFIQYNSAVIVDAGTIGLVSDDIFKRCLTWNLYKGDGFQFNVKWLKNRIIRFLSGANGVAPRIDNTYNISVTYDNNNNIFININTFYESNIAPILHSAMESGAVSLPFQYNFFLTY